MIIKMNLQFILDFVVTNFLKGLEYEFIGLHCEHARKDTVSSIYS